MAGSRLRAAGRPLAAFHIGSEARHGTDWLAHVVDVDSRFLEPPRSRRLERTSYPGEHDTGRGYLLARRRS